MVTLDNNKLRVDFNPSHDVFNKLMELLDEYKFYDGILQPHDRSRISRSYSRGGFIVLYKEDNPIGFTVWNGEDQSAEIEYKWIIPSLRGNGFGKKFAEIIYAEFVKRAIYFVVVQPATPCGHGMSRHFGFKPLADTDYRFSTNLQYLFLRENRPQVALSNKGYELLIWHDSNRYDSPAQIYKLDDTMEECPIITIVDSDAYVEILKDGIPLIENTCKHVFSDRESQYYGLFYFSTNISDWIKTNL